MTDIASGVFQATTVTYYAVFGDYFYFLIILLAFLVGAIGRSIVLGLLLATGFHTILLLAGQYGFIPMSAAYKVVGQYLLVGLIGSLLLLMLRKFI